MSLSATRSGSKAPSRVRRMRATLHDSFINSAQAFDPEDEWEVFDKDDCKNGSWQILTQENGTGFSNQGQCTSYANNY